ncbi:DUF3253 domain-containing protein [Sphingobacterium paludis]|uniref:2'-5' RNA ligase n=1 Tax=Sphingobacterium paludis TaxID=1476465 RepID=A0A4R7D4S4_9SPHI|nr:DUF3253 domain-containing protein [Sphingobacterium paludis]TDS14695.1 2'-5' RNA ligase [Sphingobacterium paludis]
MQTTEDKIIFILTLRLDTKSQAFFDRLRAKYFPPERNYLRAHLTLFHKLPDHPRTLELLRGFRFEPFTMAVSGLMHLGAGVAYHIDSPELQRLHQRLRTAFAADIVPQDQQRFKPHITVQNKVTPEASKKLLAQLSDNFAPFKVRASGLDLWVYRGGPWEHHEGFDFVADTAISESILSTTAARGPQKSVCPSEIARMLYPEDWREHMQDIVDVAISLHKLGKVQITQKGSAIDVDHIKGPIRITCR